MTLKKATVLNSPSATPTHGLPSSAVANETCLVPPIAPKLGSEALQELVWISLSTLLFCCLVVAPGILKETLWNAEDMRNGRHNVVFIVAYFSPHFVAGTVYPIICHVRNKQLRAFTKRAVLKYCTGISQQPQINPVE